jgi:hypothetical protein
MPRAHTTVTLPRVLMEFLGRFGARPDRGGGTFSRSNVLARHLDLYAGVVHNSDPRVTRGFPQPYYDLTLALLADPWSIRARDLPHLPQLLQALPEFEDLARRHGVDTAAYLRALGELAYSERLVLLARAEEQHAPPPTEP